MSNKPTPTLKDSLSTMISSALSAVKADRLDIALDWAGQAVQATSTSDDVELRTQVNSTISLILMKAAVDTRTASLRGAAIFSQLDPKIQVIVRGATLLKDMAAGADRGLGQAFALVIGGYGKQLSAAVAPHLTSQYVQTDAATLDGFLNTINALIKAIAMTTGGDEPEGISASDRTKLAATTVSNARHSLSKIGFLCDWAKARVLARHAQALVETSHAQLKDRFAAAEQAMAANNYKVSSTTLQSIEKDLGGGE